MSNNKKGKIGLTKVIADLTEKDFEIFLPLTDTTCVDLIVANSEMKTARVQVKHRKLKNGCLHVKAVSVVNGKDVLIDKTKIDVFAVYCPDTKEIYYIPISLFGEGYCLSLRIDEPKMIYKTMKMARDYISLTV